MLRYPVHSLAPVHLKTTSYNIGNTGSTCNTSTTSSDRSASNTSHARGARVSACAQRSQHPSMPLRTALRKPSSLKTRTSKLRSPGTRILRHRLARLTASPHPPHPPPLSRQMLHLALDHARQTLCTCSSVHPSGKRPSFVPSTNIFLATAAGGTQPNNSHCVIIQSV